MVPREGYLPGLERRVQGRSGEAVITREALLETSGGGGGSLGQSRGFVGTNPGLAIWHPANPNLPWLSHLDPVFRPSRSAKRWASPRLERKGPWCIPMVTASPAELREPAELVVCVGSALGCAGGKVQ